MTDSSRAPPLSTDNAESIPHRLLNKARKGGNLPGDLEAATFPEEQGSLPHDAFVSAEVHIFIRIHRRYGAAGNSRDFGLSAFTLLLGKVFGAAGELQQGAAAGGEEEKGFPRKRRRGRRGTLRSTSAEQPK